MSFLENELEFKAKEEIQNTEELKQISTREKLMFQKEHIGAKKVEENIIVKKFELSNLSKEDSSRNVEISDWKQKIGMKTGLKIDNIEGRKNELEELIEDINDNRLMQLWFVCKKINYTYSLKYNKIIET